MSPAPESAMPGGRSIMEQLDAVDVSRLDQLLALRSEQERLQTFRQKALEKQDQVPPAVRARVLADYEQRFALLDQQSAPLRAAARAEYRKVQSLMEGVGRTRTSALERRQEAQFRHEVGELTDAELADRLAEPDAIIAQCDRDAAALQDVAARFADALGADLEMAAEEPLGVAELQAPLAEDSTPQTVIAPAPPMPEPAFYAQPATAPPPPPLPSVPPLPSMQASAPATAIGGIPIFDGGDDAFAELGQGTGSAGPATFAMSRDQVEQHLGTYAEPAAPAVASASAVLVFDDEGDIQEFALGPGVTEIGRADSNQVQIVKPGISRRHASIEETPAGFVLRDLGSNNGTYVNGEQITERMLASGDVVEFGPVRVMFLA